MALLRIIFGFLRAVLLTLLYQWVPSLIATFCLFWKRLCAGIAREQLPGRQGKASTNPCDTLSNPAMLRPDPLIYDQYYLMALGFAVTWDNPDIVLKRGGVPVSPDDLQPNTTYNIVAQIWNGSTEAPVMGLPVTFSYLSFGIGVQSNLIGKQYVDLGVKGDPPAQATQPWTTPAVPGHYCIQVSFAWFDDANPFNNLGQENTQVVQTQSPATLTFQLRNSARVRQDFRFETDAYTIPPLPPCDQTPAGTRPPTSIRTGPWTPVRVQPAQSRANYKLPDAWTVTFAPDVPQLAPEEEITVTVTIVPPAGFVGRQPINVNAFTATGIAGGITVYVDVS
jgi:hypothetical protein